MYVASDIMEGWIMTTGIDYNNPTILLYYCNSVASYICTRWNVYTIHLIRGKIDRNCGCAISIPTWVMPLVIPIATAGEFSCTYVHMHIYIHK